MPDPTAALYVRLPHPEFEKLHRAAEALATNKKTIVTGLVSRYVDPDSAASLDALRNSLGPDRRRVTINLPDEGLAVGHHAFTPAPLPDVLTPAQAADLLQVRRGPSCSRSPRRAASPAGGSASSGASRARR